MIKPTRNYAHDKSKHIEAINRILSELHKLRVLDIRCGDYKEVDIKPKSLVYLDPPYSGSGIVYSCMQGFDYKEFYEYCIDIAKNNVVYISSYYMPRHFRCVDVFDNKNKSTICSSKKDISDTMIKDECLWVVKGGYGIDRLYDIDFE